MSTDEDSAKLQLNNLKLEIAELRRDRSDLERQKLSLEVRDLINRVSFWGRLSQPFVAHRRKSADDYTGHPYLVSCPAANETHRANGQRRNCNQTSGNA
jgi:hypothetical protein